MSRIIRIIFTKFFLKGKYMKKLLFLTVPLILAGAISLTNQSANANYADYELRPGYHKDINDFSLSDLTPRASQYTYDDLPNNGSLGGSYSQFENIADATSYLGYGYDVLNSHCINANDVLKSNPIFDMNQLRNTYLTIDTHFDSFTDAFEESSMSDFSDHYNAAIGLNVGYGPFFSGGFKADFEGSHNQKTYYYFYKFLSYIKTFNLTMSAQTSDLRAMLTSDFEYDLYNREPSYVFDKYGTHFLKDVMMGGRLEYNVTYSSSEVGDVSSFQASVDANVQYMNFCLGIDASGGYGSTSLLQQLRKSQNVCCLGGDLFPMTGAEAVAQYYNEWVASLRNDLSKAALINVPNKNALVPLWELVDPNNQARINVLKNYFIQALANSNNSLCNMFQTYGINKVTATKEGSGSISGNQIYYITGTTATLTATPNGKSVFDGWYINGSRVSTNRTYSFVVQSDVTLKARFINVITMDGEGNDGSPFLITTAAHFNQIQYNLTAHYKLNNDINFEGASFTPINGTFTGKFDGNGKTISNFKFDYYFGSGSGSKNIGLFDTVGSDGYIHDLRIANAKITTTQGVNDNTLVFAGLICGMNYGGTILNCDFQSTEVSIDNKFAVVGTVAGFSNGTIRNCDLLGVKVFGRDVVGGIAGTLDYHSVTENCTIAPNEVTTYVPITIRYFTFRIPVTTSYPSEIKLLAGTNASGSYRCGGISGYSYSNTIKNCSVKNVAFKLAGSTTRNPAMGFVTGYLCYGNIYYKAADISGNTTETSDTSYTKYYFSSEYNGLLGRYDGGTVTTNY